MNFVLPQIYKISSFHTTIRWGMWHTWWEKTLHTRFWYENVKERDHLTDLETRRLKNNTMDLKQTEWTGLGRALRTVNWDKWWGFIKDTNEPSGSILLHGVNWSVGRSVRFS
jgi:hypothetical protein